MFVTALGFLYTFLTVYFIPFIFAIGMIYLITGLVRYYITPDDYKEQGRKDLLWSFLVFVIGLIIYGLVMMVIWLGNQYTDLVTSDSGINAGQETRLQRVPDVPTGNN